MFGVWIFCWLCFVDHLIDVVKASALSTTTNDPFKRISYYRFPPFILAHSCLVGSAASFRHLDAAVVSFCVVAAAANDLRDAHSGGHHSKFGFSSGSFVGFIPPFQITTSGRHFSFLCFFIPLWEQTSLDLSFVFCIDDDERNSCLGEDNAAECE